MEPERTFWFVRDPPRSPFVPPVGEIVPALSVKPNPDSHFGGVTVDQPDDRSFELLRACDRVRGVELLEGGNGEVVVRGDQLHRTEREARAALKNQAD